MRAVAHARARLLVVFAAIAAAYAPAHADTAIGVSPYAGARALDAALDDYRWDVGPSRLIGAEAWARFARLEAALAVERSSTVQATGLPGESQGPRVDLTQIALRLRARVVSAGPVHLRAGAGLGRLHLGWDPDRAAFAIDGIADPVEVRYTPIDTWRTELEAGARIALPGPVDLVLASTWAHFDLATSHRSADAIVERDETFSTFDARIHLSWSLWGER